MSRFTLALLSLLVPCAYAGPIPFITSYSCSPNNNCSQNGLSASFNDSLTSKLWTDFNDFEVTDWTRVYGSTVATGGLSIAGTATLDVMLWTEGAIRPGIFTYTTHCDGGAGQGAASILLNGTLLGQGYACTTTQTIPFVVGIPFELEIVASAAGQCAVSPCDNGGGGVGGITFTVAEAVRDTVYPYNYFYVDVPVLVPEPSASTLLAIGTATLLLLRPKNRVHPRPSVAPNAKTSPETPLT